MAITGQTFTKAFVVAGQKFYAADFLVLIAEMQALNDEVVSEAIANAGNQSVGGVKTFSSVPVFSAGANMGSAKVTAVLDPTANQDAATKAYVDIQERIKCWGKITHPTTLSTGSQNISGVTNPVTGKYVVSWDTNFASEDYSVVFSTRHVAAATRFGRITAQTLTSVTIEFRSASSAANVDGFNVIAFGAQ